MKEVKVWRVFYTSIARVRAGSAAEAIDHTHRVAGAALKQARKVTPALADDVDIENIDMVSAIFCGTEEVPRRSHLGVLSLRCRHLEEGLRTFAVQSRSVGTTFAVIQRSGASRRS